MHHSHLYYICGAVASGRQTLARTVRERLPTWRLPIFAHRSTTDPLPPAGGDYIALTEAEFDHRLQLGCFAMHWFSDGAHVAVGIEINQWLGMGLGGLMIGDPNYLPQAAAHYPELRPILIRCSPENRSRRLLPRQGLDPRAFTRRLQRSSVESDLRHPHLRVIDNDGLLHRAVESRQKLLLDSPGEPPVRVRRPS